jgi:hypothetical protein
MIKILSGQTNPGGSTIAFINLCNLFNENGYDCTFYGPHQWHLDKCKSGTFQDVNLKNEDIIIYHYLDFFKTRPPVKKFVLSLHEKDLYNLNVKEHNMFDTIHFLNDKHIEWHGGKDQFKNYFISPNVVDNLVPSPKLDLKVGGVIGTIMHNKQTHKSIERALNDGCEQVHVYGQIGDYPYYNKFMSKYESYKNVYFHDFTNDKQSVYDSVTDVYQDSLSETWGYIKVECDLTNTNYHGNDSVKDNFVSMSNKEILEKWVKELEL